MFNFFGLPSVHEMAILLPPLKAVGFAAIILFFLYAFCKLLDYSNIRKLDTNEKIMERLKFRLEVLSAIQAERNKLTQALIQNIPTAERESLPVKEAVARFNKVIKEARDFLNR